MSDDCGLPARWKLALAASVDPRITKSDLAVLLAVADRILDKPGADGHGTCYPGLTRIATDAKVDRTTAVRGIAKLVDHGYLERVSGTRTTSNVYRLGRCAPAPSGESAPRCKPAPEVGANQCSKVGAALHLKPASKNRPQEPTGPRKRVREQKLTFKQWMETVQNDEEKAIPGGDPIFQWAEDAGISYDFLYLAWYWFSTRYREDSKTYADWRAVFRRCVREDWHRCWRFDHATGQFTLTTTGQQLQRQLDAQDRRAA